MNMSRKLPLGALNAGGGATGASARERERLRHEGRQGPAACGGGEAGGLRGRRHGHREARAAREAREERRLEECVGGVGKEDPM